MWPDRSSPLPHLASSSRYRAGPARKIWAALAVLVFTATAGTITLTQQSAQAASWEDCSRHGAVLCLYDLPNAWDYLNAGSLARFSFTTQRNQCISAGWWNDMAGSAFVLGTNRFAYAYEHGGCRGRVVKIGGPYGNKPTLGALNNKISSVRLY
jgi:hypothetical protein